MSWMVSAEDPESFALWGCPTCRTGRTLSRSATPGEWEAAVAAFRAEASAHVQKWGHVVTWQRGAVQPLLPLATELPDHVQLTESEQARWDEIERRAQ